MHIGAQHRWAAFLMSNNDTQPTAATERFRDITQPLLGASRARRDHGNAPARIYRNTINANRNLRAICAHQRLVFFSACSRGEEA